MKKTYELEPDGARPILFYGERIGSASSYRPGKDRWSEARVYRLDPAVAGDTWPHHYAAELAGVSTLAGEAQRCRAEYCHGLRDLVCFFMQPGGGLGELGKRVLEKAGFDPWDEYVAVADLDQHPDYNDAEREREAEREGTQNDLAEARRHK